MDECTPGCAPPPERTTYRVTYTVAGTAAIRRADVTLLPGYSQESDIPRLIAAGLTGRPADARSITLLGLRVL
jgi:hypothetical protein